MSPVEPAAARRSAKVAFWTFLRVIVVLAVSILSGVWSAHRVVARAVAQGRPEYEVRLASYMAGLFVAGSMATLAGVAILLTGRNRGSG